MWFLTLCLALTLLGTGAAPHDPDIKIHSRIVGGWDCAKKSQPWQAFVFFTSVNTTMCGGVLVHPQWVLTAAHCIGEKYEVYLGISDFSDNSTYQFSWANASFPHPLYNMTLRELQKKTKWYHPEYFKIFRVADFSHDLMLLHLENPVQQNDAVQVLNLPTGEPQVGSKCYASGWGETSPYLNTSNLPEKLQCVNLTLLSNDICSSTHLFKVTEFMLCAGDMEGHKDTCRGDSGGPLICDGVLHGITSWGPFPCAHRGNPGVYVKLLPYVNWIQNTITTYS